jgi:hypothetical protein
MGREKSLFCSVFLVFGCSRGKLYGPKVEYIKYFSIKSSLLNDKAVEKELCGKEI